MSHRGIELTATPVRSPQLDYSRVVAKCLPTHLGAGLIA
jgi:hypothetical protein